MMEGGWILRGAARDRVPRGPGSPGAGRRFSKVQTLPIAHAARAGARQGPDLALTAAWVSRATSSRWRDGVSTPVPRGLDPEKRGLQGLPQGPDLVRRPIFAFASHGPDSPEALEGLSPRSEVRSMGLARASRRPRTLRTRLGAARAKVQASARAHREARREVPPLQLVPVSAILGGCQGGGDPPTDGWSGWGDELGVGVDVVERRHTRLPAVALDLGGAEPQLTWLGRDVDVHRVDGSPVLRRAARRGSSRPIGSRSTRRTTSRASASSCEGSSPAVRSACPSPSVT